MKMRVSPSVARTIPAPLAADSSVRTRTSGDGNFLALTYMVRASSRKQLDDIYRELTACKSVLMAL